MRSATRVIQACGVVGSGISVYCSMSNLKVVVPKVT